MTIRSRVNLEIVRCHASKKDVERDLGISHDTLWRWSTDKGIASASIGKLERLADYLGCNVKDLFEEE